MNGLKEQLRYLANKYETKDFIEADPIQLKNRIMDEKDELLIVKGLGINCVNWYMIDALIEQAESPEAKEKLRVIRNRKYHEEESKCDLG